MKKEIAAVVFFLKRLIKKTEKLAPDRVELFVERLTVALQEKFKGHWYADNPSKGQAYRCIRVNRFHKEDADLLKACAESGVQYTDLGLPKELTLWVDPGEVCCRYGEKNPAFTVASFSSDDGDDKEDVTKKVTSAVERVTSDYHSGSSSDEDSGFREARFTPPFTQNRPSYQLMYPPAPVWHSLPRKRNGPGKGLGPPRPHYGFRPPPSRPIHPFKPNHWAQHGYRSQHAFWGCPPTQAHPYPSPQEHREHY